MLGAHHLKPIITVVGSIHMDFYIHLPKLPKEDETVVGYEFKMRPGGKGANQAVAAARLGAKVFFIGRVGSDFLGPMLLENLRSNNVDVSYLTVDQSTHTGVAFILLNSRGENMIAVAPGTDSRVSPDDVDKALPAVKSSQALLLQLEIPMETVVYAARRAWEAGSMVVLNPAPARPLPDEIYRYIYAMTPNRVELAMLTQSNFTQNMDLIEVARMARALVDRGVRCVVVTLGKGGALAVTQDDALHIPAFEVSPVVDTTGAGDVFTAALTVALAEGKSLADACVFANAAAAIKITRFGAQATPTRMEVEELIASRRADVKKLK